MQNGSAVTSRVLAGEDRQSSEAIGEDKQFFFEKKNQKTFARRALVQPEIHNQRDGNCGSTTDKSFLVLFFKKGLLAYPSLDFPAGEQMTQETSAIAQKSFLDRFLRDAAWLTRQRVRAYCLMLACAMGLWGAGMVGAQIAGAQWGGVGGDFPCFYAAGRMVQTGQTAHVYEPAAMEAAERGVARMHADAYLPFFYPPPFLLLCWAISLLPYWVAFACFMLAGVLPLAAAARSFLPEGMRLLPLLAFPGLWITFLSGQNGLLSAACLAWFALLADRRPLSAGACLGVLACKPQLAICVPFALVASRRWASLFAACACILGLCVASVAFLGIAPWVAFLHSFKIASTAITGGMIPQARIQSAFVAARLLGAGLLGAGLVQAIVAGAALCVLVAFAWTRPAGVALGAALAVCALLVTPYVMDYDLVCMAPALALHRWPPYGRIIVFVAFLLPIASGLIALNTHVQVAPLVLASLLYVAVRGQGGQKSKGSAVLF